MNWKQAMAGFLGVYTDELAKAEPDLSALLKTADRIMQVAENLDKAQEALEQVLSQGSQHERPTFGLGDFRRN